MPGEFVAPRTFYRWLESLDFKLSPEQYATYERAREAAIELHRALDNFQREFATDSRVISPSEDVAIGNARRIMRLIADTGRVVEIVERKRPRYPGQKF